jgi:hypothetical protein
MQFDGMRNIPTEKVGALVNTNFLLRINRLLTTLEREMFF